MNKRARLITILAIVFVLLCAAFVLVKQLNSNRIKKDAEAYSQIIQPLEMELVNLEKELAATEQAETKASQQVATIEILFTDLSPNIMRSAFKPLKRLQCKGNLLLSPKQMPGMNGFITLEQMQTLLAEGWEYYWLYDGSSEMDDWYREMQETLVAYDLAAPDTVYCAEDQYNTGLDETLLTMGFTNVVHHGEEGLDLYNTQPESNGLWRVGTIDVSSLSGEAALESTYYQIISSHANIVISLPSTGNNAYLLWNNFEQITNTYYAPHINSGTLVIQGIAAARSVQEENVSRALIAVTGHGPEYLEIQQKIEALRQKIEALQAEYIGR